MKPDALIVIDVQQALIDDHPYGEQQLLHTLSVLLAECRAQSVPVIYVQHEEDGELAHGSRGWQVAGAIAPKDGEPRIYKRFSSAFRQTELHALLQSMRAQNLILCGMQTEYCVDATCKVAFELGYNVTVPHGGTSTYDNGPFKAQDLIAFYEKAIWADRFAQIRPLESVLGYIRGEA